MVAAAGYFGTREVRGSMGEIVQSAKALRYFLEADQIHDALRGDVFAALFDSGESSGKRADALKRAQAHATQLMDRVAKSRVYAPARERQAIDAATPALGAYAKFAEEMVTLAYQDRPAASVKIHEFMNSYRDLQAVTSRIEDAIDHNNDATQQRGAAAGDASVRAMIAVCVLASFLIAGFSVLFGRGILRSLRHASEAATRVASGDLSQPIAQAGTDEIGLLLRTLEKMRADLAAAVAEIQLAARNVDTGSKEISRGNADLSSRTEEQASSLEETAGSMEEITATIKRNTENARQANELAAGAAGIARRGGEAMNGVVTTMGAISEASRRIAEITGVIDAIAFQTNILALNAAVEAARAGEHGRGFAVVASEVRALAQRCSVAAKEIKDLIAEASRRVSEGTGQVDGAGLTMQQIVDAVQGVSGIVREMSDASAEQLRGIEQVSQAITQMDHAVQQNAALVEEAAAAAESLAGQADAMAVTVRHFKLGDERVAEVEAPRAPAKGHAQRIDKRAPAPVRALAEEWREF
jgi:methyl-accepting chemotaxis protein